MASVDSIVAQLRAAVDHLHQALAHARGGQEQAEELRDLFDQLGTPSLAAQMQDVVDQSGDLVAMLAAGIERGEELIAQTEAIRHGGGGGVAAPAGERAAGTSNTPEPDVPVPDPFAPVTPGWRRPSEVPEHAREAGARLRPRPPEEEARFTAGILNGELIHSGGNDRSLAADLDHAPLRLPPVTFYDHVESKVAARMRRDKREGREGWQRAEVTVDNTPCGAIAQEQAFAWGCDRILPGLLPRGSTLVVWSTLDGGRTFWRRAYHGTGERIRE